MTYANVVSTIALFLVLGGATALAAQQLAKNSVGTKQLKENAVTDVKIKDGAVGTTDLDQGAVTHSKLGAASVGTVNLEDGSVTTAKLADGAVSAAKLQPGLQGSAGVVASARGEGPKTVFPGETYKLSRATYTQAVGEDDFYVGAATVTVPSTCAPPRKVAMKIALDPMIPGNPSEGEVVGTANFEIGGNGTVTRRLAFGIFNNGTTTRLAPDVATQHNLSISGETSCEGEEAPLIIQSAGVDVIGVR